jgi:hypothetical protein
LKGGSKQGGFARTRDSNYHGQQREGANSKKGPKGRLQGESPDKQIIPEAALLLRDETENTFSNSPTKEINHQKSPMLTRSKSEGFRLGTRTVIKQESTLANEDRSSHINQAEQFTSSCNNHFSEEVWHTVYILHVSRAAVKFQ